MYCLLGRVPFEKGSWTFVGFNDFYDTWYERYPTAILFRCPAATALPKREFARWEPDYRHLIYDSETVTWKYFLEKYQTFTGGNIEIEQYLL